MKKSGSIRRGSSLYSLFSLLLTIALSFTSLPPLMAPAAAQGDEPPPVANEDTVTSDEAIDEIEISDPVPGTPTPEVSDSPETVSPDEAPFNEPIETEISFALMH